MAADPALRDFVFDLGRAGDIDKGQIGGRSGIILTKGVNGK